MPKYEYQQVIIDYTNWRGERAERRITPHTMRWGKNAFHGEEPQWLLEAFDEEKKGWRTFAMKDIHAWRPA